VATITQSDWGINATSPSTSKIMGNLLFVAWYQSGLMVFDISTPSNPMLVGNYDTWHRASALAEQVAATAIGASGHSSESIVF